MTTTMGPVTRIISGGQTGADRAALDWALHVGIPIGGWCPLGRRAEDGKVPEWYELMETTTKDYRLRTELNVRDSTATVIYTASRALSAGSRVTLLLARRMDRPCLHLYGLEQADAYRNGGELATWLGSLRGDWRDPMDTPKPFVLNVAGTRQSNAPGIVGAVHATLGHALSFLDY